MTGVVDKSKSTAAEVIIIDVNASNKHLFALLNASPSIAVSQAENSDCNNVVAVPGIASLMAPSTDTTLSTITAKIEDQPNETDFLFLQLDDSSDIEDNETCSVSSSTSSVISRYFEPTDFLPWEELYSKAEYAPHVGFAMVAGGFACLHPFVFFAGVVTAVGALRAAGATYEYAHMERRQTKTRGLEGDGSIVDDWMIPCDCFPTTLRFNDTDHNIRALSPAHEKVGDAEIFPPLAKSCSTCSTNASTIGDLSDNANIKAGLADVRVSSVPSIIKSTPEALQTKEETFDSSRWVTENFPVLPIIALENFEFRGLNAFEFFDVFFADDAPFGFPAFHKLRRDKEVQYGPWNTGVSSDKPNSKSIEFLPSIAAKERAVQYHAKTNSFLGPAYAPTKKIQRAYFVSKKMLVIEIRLTLHDIPFSKHFFLIERWVIDGTRCGFETIGSSSTNNNRNSSKKDRNPEHHYNNDSNSTKASSSHCVYLTISSEVYFTQECPFESAVRKESTKQVCEISKCWNAMAQAGLKRTEETRTKRLRQKEKERTQQESPELLSNMNSSIHNKNKFENYENVEIEHIEYNPVVGDHSNDRRGGGRKMSSTRNRRRSSRKHQKQHPPKLHFHNRRLSRSFSKLLARGGNSSKIGDKPPPKVRISSAGVPSCKFRE